MLYVYNMCHIAGALHVLFHVPDKTSCTRPSHHRLVGLNYNKAQTLSPATNSCRHFPPSTTLSPDCFVSCQVTPVIRYFLANLEEQENYCLCDCLSLNNTNNLPSGNSPLHPPSPLHFPHLPTQTAHFTDSAEQLRVVCDLKLCLHVRSVCMFLCMLMLSLQTHTE